MAWSLRILLLVIGLALLGVVLALMRRRRLREEFAVLWVAAALAMLLFFVMPSLLVGVADALGLAPSVLALLVLWGFLAAIMLHYGVAVTAYREREKTLSQEVTLLKDELMSVRGEMREAPPPPPEPKPRPPSLRT